DDPRLLRHCTAGCRAGVGRICAGAARRRVRQEVTMTTVERLTRNERDAYRLLYAGFVAATIVDGFDKFTDKLGNWDRYLADGVAERLPVERHTFMQAVGLKIGRASCREGGLVRV